MKIIETSFFTKKVNSLISDEDYHNLQNQLIANPKQGKIIRGSNGLRKFRWKLSRTGKSGGVRIIYYWISKEEIILMLLVYSKKEQDNLTSAQLKILKSIVEKELK